MNASRLLNRSFSLTRLRRASLLAWSVGTLAVAPATHAVVVPLVTMNWGAGAFAVTGDSDVSTAGIFVSAFNFGDPAVTPATINGVTFAAAAVTNGTTSASFGGYSLDETDPGYELQAATATPSGSLSAGYQTLLSTSAGANAPRTLVLTFSYLTPGNNYLFQWWNNFQATEATGAFTLGPGAQGFGQYALGTFTAVNAAMKIEFNGVPFGENTTFPSINAFQLRDVTAVPEPATYAALLGLAGLGVALLRRRQKEGRN